MAQCTLLSGPWHWLLQVVLLLVSLSVLAIKHWWEQHTQRSDRSTARFFFDSSKQLVGAGWMHAMNLLFAQVLASHTSEDSCEWYWIEIMVDTTLGVYVEFSVMQLVVSCRHWRWEALRDLAELVQESCIESEGGGADAERADGAGGAAEAGDLQQGLLQAEGGTSGQHDFGDILARLSLTRYLMQLAVWLVVVTIMKLVMLTLMGVFGPQFLDLAQVILGCFRSMPVFELFFVMILTPALMDAVQFVLQDNIFMDLDEGHLVELPPRRAPLSNRTRKSHMQDLRAANDQVILLNEDNDELRIQIAALRAELTYHRSGFLARIILVSFMGAQEDQVGLYRATQNIQTYQQAEFPLKTFAEGIGVDGVFQVVELRRGENLKQQPVTWARIQKPQDHWILLVNGLGRHCARKLISLDTDP
mmetsp:Transcript_69351/g.203042  ORF Transcript_69351/g.203042 Transcript_69351/m.203042 type:complete len:418 (-) Transcript_69351:135-1388(-)